MASGTFARLPDCQTARLRRLRSGIANSDILKSYLGLLCLGKNDFDAIEGQRKDAFGINAAVLGMKISGKPIDFGVLPCGYMPLDVDTFACANSGTVKEHVKTDMDLVRLPSGKFDTNYLVCALAAVAMNLVRLVGQHTLHEPDAPVRHTAQRRRIRTVMQELMFNAARMVHHARQWVLEGYTPRLWCARQ